MMMRRKGNYEEKRGNRKSEFETTDETQGGKKYKEAMMTEK